MGSPAMILASLDPFKSVDPGFLIPPHFLSAAYRTFGENARPDAASELASANTAEFGFGKTADVISLERWRTSIARESRAAIGHKAEAVISSMRFDEEMSAIQNFLLDLPAGWDGYDADPISPALLGDLIVQIKSAAAGLEVPAPDIVPGADGSLQAEWHLQHFELTYDISADGDAYLWSHDRVTGKERSERGAAAQKAFPSWARRLKRPALYGAR